MNTLEKRISMWHIIWQGITDKVTLGFGGTSFLFGGIASILSGVSAVWIVGIIAPSLVAVFGVVKHWTDIKLNRTKHDIQKMLLEKERLQLQIMRNNMEAEINTRAEEILKDFKKEKDE